MLTTLIFAILLSLSRQINANWWYNSDQCETLLTVVADADENGSGGLDSQEFASFYNHLLIKSSAPCDGAWVEGPDPYLYEELLCECYYTFHLPWRCCDGVTTDDPQFEGTDWYPLGEVPLGGLGKNNHQKNKYMKRICTDMFEIVEWYGGDYELDLTLGATISNPTTMSATTSSTTMATISATTSSMTTTTTPEATTVVATTLNEQVEETSNTSSSPAPENTADTTEEADSPEESTATEPTTTTEATTTTTTSSTFQSTLFF